MLFLLDRRGGLHQLVHGSGDTLSQALLRNDIPPTSVIAFRNDDSAIINDGAPLDEATTYTARLIEGYDIAGILAMIREGGTAPADDAAYAHRRLRVGVDGRLSMERTSMTTAAVADHVTATVADTISMYNLTPPGEPVVIGLSGGVDSGSLLTMLARQNDHPRLIAATFEDADAESPTFEVAASLAYSLGVEHHFISADSAQKVFHLTQPLANVLSALMATEDAHSVMYADHHTTRRALEVFADSHGAQTVALGLHATDLLAGHLNAMTSGWDVGGVPDRTVGRYRYILPLAFIPKRELHLSVTHERGIPQQTFPNQWEFNPTDRNFYYYLADYLQWHWPGIAQWMLTVPTTSSPAQFTDCENCEAPIRVLTGVSHVGVCDVCALFDRHGYLA